MKNSHYSINLKKDVESFCSGMKINNNFSSFISFKDKHKRITAVLLLPLLQRKLGTERESKERQDHKNDMYSLFIKIA